MKIKALLIISLVCFFGCKENTSTNKKKATDVANKKISKNDVRALSGEWQKDCNGESGFIFIEQSLDTAVIEVNNNQIEINAKIEIKTDQNKIELVFRLIDPNDLGNGGVRLHWNDFSHDSIIAKMDITDSSNAILTWYGFYDGQLKKRTWTNNFDIFSDDPAKNQTTIKKCEGLVFSPQ